MINFLTTLISQKGDYIMGRKRLANSTKFLNALLRGDSISWNEARTTFSLQRPRAVVEKLREDGHCVYVNKTTSGTSYRIGTPSKAIIAAGLKALDGAVYA